MAQNPVVIDMNARTNNANNKDGKDKKQDSLFGPNIGVINSGPAWTSVNEKKVLADELTQDVVKGWIDKSKEANQPTTTLQALVNLKRPTLRLSPLHPSDDQENNEHEHEHLHGLEFEYDCDAPKCGIYVHVLLPSEHPEAPVTASSNGLSKLLVFESVVDGGFGRVLKLEEGATLELGRFENIPVKAAAKAEEAATAPPLEPVAESSTGGATASGESPNSTSNPATPPTEQPLQQTSSRSRRRFTAFNFRKSHHRQNRSVSGPALAVVDAEPSSTNKDEEGVRVTIRLAALDEQGTELASPNEQVTYLQVVRFGELKKQEENGESQEDVRPWVVKVVKREATIGPHTFHLHEIYGLTSSSSTTHAPTASLPDSHTYPPTNNATQPAEDEPSSECLLCLSSPREVVLLPCRHLVACKECALNMVEFGAGGTITQAADDTAPAAPTSPVPATAEDNTNAEGASANAEAGDAADAAAAPAPAPASAPASAAPASAAPATPAIPTTPITPTATTANPRRKRKAKGWFCPVCRQPYSSLLRITTTPPPPKEESSSAPAENAEGTADIAPPPATAGGLFGGMRPNFLRALSRPAGTPQQDLEAQRPVAPVA